MSDRITISFSQPLRTDSRSRDALIALSATAFAIGFVLLLMIMPQPERHADGIAGEPEATEVVSGP